VGVKITLESELQILDDGFGGVRMAEMAESERTSLSKLRGEGAAKLQLTPERRRAYIARQGKAETKERRSGVGSPEYDVNNPRRVRAETYGQVVKYRGQRRGKSSR
jgi:hypothetical protein